MEGFLTSRLGRRFGGIDPFTSALVGEDEPSILSASGSMPPGLRLQELFEKTRSSPEEMQEGLLALFAPGGARLKERGQKRRDVLAEALGGGV